MAYEVKAYTTDKYDHDSSGVFRDLEDVLRWAVEFLSLGGRKVIVYSHEKRRHWRSLGPLRRKIFVWTDAEQVVRRDGYCRK